MDLLLKGKHFFFFQEGLFFLFVTLLLTCLPLNAGLKQMTLEDTDLPTVNSIKQKISNYTNAWYSLPIDSKKIRNSAVKLANEANAFYEKKDYPSSLNKYSEALKIWPDLKETYAGYAAALYQSGKLDEAEKYVNLYLEDYNSLDPNAFKLNGLICYKNGKFEKALDNYFKLAKVQNNNKEVWTEIANIYYESATYDYAFKMYQNALKNNPADARIYLGIGNIYLINRDYKEAQKTFEKGIKLSPKNKDLLEGYDRATAFILIETANDQIKKQKLSDALMTLSSADKLLPDYYQTILAMARIEFKLNHLPESRKFYQRASEMNPEIPESFYFLGVMAQKANDLTNAMFYYSKAEALSPSDPELFNRIAEIQITRGFYDKAIDALQKSLRSQPDSLSALLNLGVAYFKKEDYSAAHQTLDKVLSLDPKNKDALSYMNKTQSVLLVSDGNLLFDKKDFKNAQVKYQQALSLNKDFPDAEISLANTYIELNQAKTAIGILASLYKDNTNSGPVIESLAEAYNRNGQPDLEKNFREKLNNLKGYDPMVFYRLGLNYELNNKYDKAIEAYDSALKISRTFVKAAKRSAFLQYKTGILDYNDGKMDSALEKLQKASAMDPENIDIIDRIAYIKAFQIIQTAITQYKSENYEKSLALYLDAQKISTNIPELYYGKALNYYELNDTTNAMLSLAKSINLRPEMTESFKLAAEIERHRNNYAMASKYLNEAIKLNKKDPELFNAIGYIFYLNNDLENSTAMYKEALALNPRDAEIHVNLGLVYFKEGRYDIAETEFSAADTLRPGQDDVYYNLGLIYFKQNRFSDSEDALLRSIAINADIPDKFFSLARSLYYSENRINDAISNAEKSIRMSPEVKYYFGSGKIYEKKMESVRLSEIEKYRLLAIESYQTVIKKAPDTQFAIWAEERLRILMEDVKLIRTYSIDQPARGGVATLGSDIYSAGLAGGIYNFNPQVESDNNVKWSYRGVSPFSKNVIVKDKTLYAADMTTVHAMNRESGDELWKFHVDDEISTPIVIGNDGTIYFGTANGNFIGVRDNVIVFEIKIGDQLTSRPLINDKMAYVTTTDGTIFAVNIQARRVLWSYFTAGKINANLILWNNMLIAGDSEGVICALELMTGTLKWKLRTDAPITQSGVLYKNFLYYISGTILYCINENGSSTWILKLPEQITALSSVNLKNCIFLGGDNGTAFSIDLTQHRILWKYRMSAPLAGDPVLIADNIGLFTTVDGIIYQLEFLK